VLQLTTVSTAFVPAETQDQRMAIQEGRACNWPATSWPKVLDGPHLGGAKSERWPR